LAGTFDAKITNAPKIEKVEATHTFHSASHIAALHTS
jgi:hypothetical protein